MQTLLTHLVKIQNEVEAQKRPSKDYLIVLEKVIHRFLSRTSTRVPSALRLNDVRSGLTIASSIEVFLGANKLAMEEEIHARELLNIVHGRIVDMTHNSSGRLTNARTAHERAKSVQ